VWPAPPNEFETPVLVDGSAVQCKRWGYTSLVNVAADSGNTPLHAAVNRADVAAVRQLLSSSDVNVNAVNRECGDATPLLLAAMHGLLVVISII